jgi:hypothetical protein
MPKKSKKHVVRKETGKKVPRMSVMEKEKKDRQKLYTFISIGAVLLLAIGITIGAIMGGSKTEAPKAELDNGHFTQKDGSFEMDPPKGWAVDSDQVAMAPYGVDNTLKAYVFRPGDYQAISESTKAANPSPNNIICGIAPNDVKADVVDNFIRVQNVIDQADIAKYLDTKAPLLGEKIKDSMGWVLDEQKDKNVTKGSFVAIVKTKDSKIYFTAKFTDEATRKEILAALKSIKSQIPESLESYTDINGIATIPRPDGWKIDTTGQSLAMHQIPPDLGAMIYPSGTKTEQQMTPAQVNDQLSKQKDKDGKPIGTVTSGLSIPTPLVDYMAIYSIDKTVSPDDLNKRFDNFIGFSKNSITNSYSWILETIKTKGLSMASCEGKYFISEKPIFIMQAVPAGTLFAVIENPKGKLLIMAGWTNDGIKKIIIDTLNKIKSADSIGK